VTGGFSESISPQSGVTVAVGNFDPCTPDYQLDERPQRALTRYYCAAGMGGVAVGVPTTQFEIHDRLE
jgi:hypothetical protein